MIVFDELQKLKDMYLNGRSQESLIKELFNFFVRLTRVLYLLHVNNIRCVYITLYRASIYRFRLVNTSSFYLVDCFDDKTTVEKLYKDVFSMMNNLLGEFYELGIKYKALKVMKQVLDGKVGISSENRKVVRTLSEGEIFFYNLVNNDVRYQPKLHKIAAREFLKVE